MKILVLSTTIISMIIVVMAFTFDWHLKVLIVWCTIYLSSMIKLIDLERNND